MFPQEASAVGGLERTLKPYITLYNVSAVLLHGSRWWPKSSWAQGPALPLNCDIDLY